MKIRKLLLLTGIPAAALLVAQPAWAGATADFSGCDGLKKPKRKNDGMRGVATLPPYSTGLSGPRTIISSCNRALERKELRPEQTLRKAHLLRSRAAAYLQLGQAEKALADLASARRAAAEYEGQYFYERSMGVSLDLIEATALAELDRWAEAAPLVDEAAANRPYAVEVQRVATLLRARNGDSQIDNEKMWATLIAIDPDVRSFARTTRNAAQDAEPDFAAILASSDESPIEFKPFPTFELNERVRVESILTEWADPLMKTADIAFAQAATRDPEGAEGTLAMLRNELTKSTEVTGENGETKPNGLAKLLASRVIEPRIKLAEMRLAVARGNLTDAAAMIALAPPIEEPKSLELYNAFASANADRQVPLGALPPLKPSRAQRRQSLTRLVPSLLIAPESERQRIDYKKSRTNVVSTALSGVLSLGMSLLGGAERTTGFRSDENDDGSIKVEYIGNTTSGPIVQEMTLLRAAEIALENEKTHFTIQTRRDYQRYLVQSMYGVERQRTLSGYKTELDIRLIDDPEGTDEEIEANAIIEALGPIYYENSRKG